MLLGLVKYDLPSRPFEMYRYGGNIRNVKIAICRVICDTPGVAEFCGIKNHRACKYNLEQKF